MIPILVSLWFFFGGRWICKNRAGARARTLPNEFYGVKKSQKNGIFTNTYFTTLFFEEQIGKSAKNDSNMGPKTWLNFGGGRLGALLGHLWRHSLVFNTKNKAKVLQKRRQGSKKYSKWGPRLRKNRSTWSSILEKGLTRKTRDFLIWSGNNLGDTWTP